MMWLLLGGLGIGAFALMKKKSDSTLCTDFSISQIEVNSKLDEIMDWGATWSSPEMSAQAALIDLMKRLRPTMSWSKSTCATFTNPGGQKFDWQTLMKSLEGVTLADVQQNPSKYGLPFGKQTSGASDRGPLSQVVLGA